MALRSTPKDTPFPRQQGGDLGLGGSRVERADQGLQTVLSDDELQLRQRRGRVSTCCGGPVVRAVAPEGVAHARQEGSGRPPGLGLAGLGHASPEATIRSVARAFGCAAPRQRGPSAVQADRGCAALGRAVSGPGLVGESYGGGGEAHRRRPAVPDSPGSRAPAVGRASRTPGLAAHRADARGPAGPQTTCSPSGRPGRGDAEAFRRAAAGWRGTVDADTLIHNIYPDRLVPTRSKPRP